MTRRGKVQPEQEEQVVVALVDKVGVDHKAVFRKHLETLIGTNQSVKMNITPEMAEVMLEKAPPGTNRALKRWLVSDYAHQMRSGHWLLSGQTIIFASDGTLNDGQHRLNACIAAGVTFLSDVRFGIDRKAFHVTDRGIGRGLGDLLHIEGQEAGNRLASILRLVWNYEQGNVNFSGRISTTDALSILEKYPELADVSRASGTYAARFSQINPSVYGLTLHCLSRIDDEQAREFFEMFTTGMGFSGPNDPVLRMRNWFINRGQLKGRRSRKEVIAVIFKGWNAWRDGRSVKMLRFRQGTDAPEAFPVPR